LFLVKTSLLVVKQGINVLKIQLLSYKFIVCCNSKLIDLKLFHSEKSSKHFFKKRNRERFAICFCAKVILTKIANALESIFKFPYMGQVFVKES